MSGPRRISDAIQWHEGMLLAPQHFQLLSLREEELLQYHALTISPFHWGVRRLEIDPVLLVEGTFRVTELEAVMPDGLLVFRPDDPSALEIDLTAFAEAMKGRPLAVHLAVPARRQGLSPVRGELPRYESFEGPAIADETSGDGDLRIPRLRPRLCLLAAEVPPQKYVSFPLARVS
nr:type VI secretion system baseplate subunit TssK [Acidobacteriota bacterium]